MAEESITTQAEGADPVAVSLALSGASREKADAYLDDQRHHLHVQLLPALWEKWLGVLLRVATACVGLGVAGMLCYLVWDAAHSRGLILEPFSVPADMAERGLNGQVVASQIIGKLSAMTARESSRAVQSYANNWGDNIKLEIPETGVSIGELRNVLRDWLGHDIHISGEVFHTAAGITVTARAGGGDAGAGFTGPESGLDALLQKAAEHVYEVTQPYRYANYLDRNYDPVGLQDRVARAAAIYRRLIAGDDPVEQAWAWNGLGTIAYNFQFDDRKSAWYYGKALAIRPDFALAFYALSARNAALGQDEDTFRNTREALRLLQSDAASDLNPRYLRSAVLQSKGRINSMLGDFAAAIPIERAGSELPDDFSVLSRSTFISGALAVMTRRHDLAATHAYMRELGWQGIPRNYGGFRCIYDLERQDWADLLQFETMARSQLSASAHNSTDRGGVNNFDTLRTCFATARAGRSEFREAEALLAPLPPDNAPGVRTRALVAEAEGQHERADWWFARSEKQTPSLPTTDLYWGQALLARGQPEAAIEKFTRANTLGPKFADPLEGWGEALMAKNESHLALAKFAEAEKYAPNWGRLHLKWGEALTYAGKAADAKVQFARAAALDLTPSEKSELARMTAHV